MKRMLVAGDIHPLSEFRSNASGFIAQVHRTKRPLIITQNGKSAAVLVDAHEYDKMVEKLETIHDIELSVNQIAEGMGVLHEQAYQRLKSRYSR